MKKEALDFILSKTRQERALYSKDYSYEFYMDGSEEDTKIYDAVLSDSIRKIYPIVKPIHIEQLNTLEIAVKAIIKLKELDDKLNDTIDNNLIIDEKYELDMNYINGLFRGYLIDIGLSEEEAKKKSDILDFLDYDAIDDVKDFFI